MHSASLEEAARIEDTLTEDGFDFTVFFEPYREGGGVTLEL